MSTVEFIHDGTVAGNALLLSPLALHAKVQQKRHAFKGLHDKAKFAHAGASLKALGCHRMTEGPGIAGTGELILKNNTRVGAETLGSLVGVIPSRKDNSLPFLCIAGQTQPGVI